MLRRIVLISACFLATRAGAVDLPEPVQQYWKASHGAHLICTVKARVFILQMDAARRGEPLPPEERAKTDPAICVDEELPKVRAAYDKALAASKKPAAKAALKEHIVITNVALKQVIPGVDDTKSVYFARNAANERRMEEQWERVKLEF